MIYISNADLFSILTSLICHMISLSMCGSSTSSSMKRLRKLIEKLGSREAASKEARSIPPCFFAVSVSAPNCERRAQPIERDELCDSLFPFGKAARDFCFHGSSFLPQLLERKKTQVRPPVKDALHAVYEQRNRRRKIVAHFSYQVRTPN